MFETEEKEWRRHHHHNFMSSFFKVKERERGFWRQFYVFLAKKKKRWEEDFSSRNFLLEGVKERTWLWQHIRKLWKWKLLFSCGMQRASQRVTLFSDSFMSEKICDTSSHTPHHIFSHANEFPLRSSVQINY